MKAAWQQSLDTGGVPLLDYVDLRRAEVHDTVPLDLDLDLHPTLPARPSVIPTPRVQTERAFEVVQDAATDRPASWMRWYVAALICLDAVAVVVAGLLALLVRFGTVDQPLKGTTYMLFVLAATVPWVGIMAASRAYEQRYLGLGSEEFRRVGNAVVRFTTLIAVVAYLLKIDVARGMVALALPLCAVLTLVQRYVARQVLHRLRGAGAACHRVLLVGEEGSAKALQQRLLASPHAGLRVVGRCSPVGRDQGGSLAHVREAIELVGADTVAVAHSPGVTPESLRRMAWALEDTGVDLLVAPAFTDVAGPRIHVRPVSGLPLLQIASPQFTGAGKVVKRAIDIAATLLLLTVLAPGLLVVALLVVITSRGPALFSQQRIGRDGRPFKLYKFRSMCVDAEQRRQELLAHNESDGVLFKMREDPRVTRVGRWMRRFSIDELPQLVNVLRGQMSLVGPRPPLPSEVAQYEQHVHRRLLVTPGLTGLWQVSGRSDLSWEESVRLDLYYVENWSVAMDAEILWKTMFAVLRGSGAH